MSQTPPEPYGHTETAAADGGVVNTNDDGEREALPDGEGEGVHPAVTNPDQPTFPAPLGVDVQDLKDQGVDTAYQGLPEEGVVGGSAPAVEGEASQVGTEAETQQQEGAAAAADNGDGGAGGTETPGSTETPTGQPPSGFGGF